MKKERQDYMPPINVVLVAIYRYLNFPLRIIHPLLETVEGVTPYTIFYKDSEANTGLLPTEQEEQLFIEKIKELNPKVVGLSVLSPYVPVAQRLTALIKEHTSALVIWGGIHPTIAPDLSLDEADVLCIGEGEGAILDLVTSLRDGKDYSGIKNLWMKKGSRVIKNSMRPLIQDLDSLPFYACDDPSFYFIETNKITSIDPLLTRRRLVVQSSRGCPFICSYCVNSILQDTFRGLGTYMRRRSVDSVMTEIKQRLAVSTTIERINFADEVFGVNEKWLEEFESRYKKEIGLPFDVEYHPLMVKPKMLERLVNAGIRSIKIGIQATSDEIRSDVFCRKGLNKDIIDLANKINSYGVELIYDFIMDNPYDTEESLKKGIEAILQLPKPLFYNLYSMQYFPYYPFTQRAIDDGHIKEGDVTLEGLFDKNLKNWAFVPSLWPLNKKQALQNIFWLYAWGHTHKATVRSGVFGQGFGARICFHYLNSKAVLYGKIFGVGGLAWRYRWIDFIFKGFRYLFKGDIKTLTAKIKKQWQRLLKSR